MGDLQNLTKELLKDQEFKKEFEKLQSERDLTMSLVRARKEAGLTQEELSKKTGISQADISMLENGTRNPSLALLNRIAEAMNSELIIDIVPRKNIAK